MTFPSAVKWVPERQFWSGEWRDLFAGLSFQARTHTSPVVTRRALTQTS